MQNFLLSNTDARDLGVLRCAIFGIWFVIIVTNSLTGYSFLSTEIFRPLGVYNFVFPDSGSLSTQFILSYTFLFWLKVALLTGCLLCLLGIRPFNWIAIPTVFLIFLVDGIDKGFAGYVGHPKFGILYGALILSFFPSADGFSVFKQKSKPEKKANYQAPIFATVFILLMTYSFVGIHRLLNGGIEIYTGNALQMYLLLNTLDYGSYGFKLGLIVANSPLLLTVFKVGYVGITIFEILSPFVLLSRRFCYLWLGAIISFHVISLLTMNIFFWENIILFLLLLCYTYAKAPPVKFMDAW